MEWMMIISRLPVLNDVIFVCRYGACASIRDIDGLLALHHAVTNKHVECVEALVAHTEALTVTHH